MQKIIYLYGPSCAGKSTIAREILKSEELSHVHYDILKWEIPNYSRDNPAHRIQILKQMSSLIQENFAAGNSLLIEGMGLELFEQVKKTYEARARVFSVKVIADQEILINRFRERLKRAESSGKKISNKSEKVFLELYEKYSREPELGITIDTSEISIPESIVRVKKYIS
jgi:adenylate kinase family enzyme